MNPRRARNALLLALSLLLVASSSAWAHGSRGRVGFYVGPSWHPWWGPSPWAYPPVVVLPAPPPAPPPVYVEQAGGGEPAPEPAWYYCRMPGGYYPNVTECPAGWLRIQPQSSP